VVALGGNAFTAEGETGEYSDQARHAAEMAAVIVEMTRSGWNLVIVHGNGPQVGNLSIQQENGIDMVPAQPLSTLVAMTQGQLGSLIAMAVQQVSGGTQLATVVTSHVLVDADDPAMLAPSKPIGPFMSRHDAQRLASERGWTVREDSGRGYRRVVASPVPRRILEIDSIRALLGSGHLVVAAGGGGIPVVSVANGRLECVEAVVDKDYAAATLAEAIGADALVIVTAVDAVALDFGAPTQRAVHRMTVTEAEGYLDSGQFPPGSMGPKIRAAKRFVQGGGEVAIITSPRCAVASLPGRPDSAEVGTHIVAGSVVTL
jgi:carbamate kinase